MDVRAGFDYHLAKVKVAHGGHRAECPSCGWYGEVRGKRTDAEEDASKHSIARQLASHRELIRAMTTEGGAMARARTAPVEDQSDGVSARELEEQARERAAQQERSRGLSEDLDATIQQRMWAILKEMPAIGKTQYNEQQRFMFRGHDDVLNALNPLLAKHGVVVVPSILERVTNERTTAKGSIMYEVNLHISYTFHGLRGDSITASTWGEGTDMGDKATNKAHTMAFKNVLNQAFAISSEEFSDSDAGTPEETYRQPVRKDAPPANVPPNWSEALKRFDGLVGEPGAGATWLGELLDKQYGVKSVGDLESVPRKKVWVGFCSALLDLEDRYGDLAFSTGLRSKVQEAFAAKNEGIALDGPGWALDPNEAETGRPTKADFLKAQSAQKEESASTTGP